MMHENGVDVVSIFFFFVLYFGYRVEIKTQHELDVYLNGLGRSFLEVGIFMHRFTN